MSNQTWPQEHTDHLMELRKLKISYWQIAKRMNKWFGTEYTREAVAGKAARVLNTNQSEKPPKPLVTDDIDPDEVRALIAKGYTIKALAGKYKVSGGAMTGFCRRNEIQSQWKHEGGAPKTNWTEDETNTLIDLANEGAEIDEMLEALPRMGVNNIIMKLSLLRREMVLPDEAPLEDNISGADLDLAKIMRSQGHSWEAIAMRLRRFTTEEVKQAATAAGIA